MKVTIQLRTDAVYLLDNIVITRQGSHEHLNSGYLPPALNLSKNMQTRAMKIDWLIRQEAVRQLVKVPQPKQEPAE